MVSSDRAHNEFGYWERAACKLFLASLKWPRKENLIVFQVASTLIVLFSQD